MYNTTIKLKNKALKTKNPSGYASVTVCSAISQLNSQNLKDIFFKVEVLRPHSNENS